MRRTLVLNNNIEQMNKESNKNKVRQEIVNKDGSKKSVFHAKKFQGAQYGSHKEWWKAVNSSPKPNSKRQKKLREAK